MSKTKKKKESIGARSIFFHYQSQFSRGLHCACLMFSFCCCCCCCCCCCSTVAVVVLVVVAVVAVVVNVVLRQDP